MARGARLVFLALIAAACRERAPRREPAPSASAPSPRPRSVCAGGGGEVTLTGYGAWFPRTSGSYCIDPNADQRAFGAPGALPLRDAAELLTLDVERLERLGLEAAATVTYTEDRDDPARVMASALRFATPEGAYGFFTERVAEAAEFGRPVFRALDAGADGVLADATALVVRADSVLRLDFTGRRLAAGQGDAAAAPVLATLAQAIAAQLPGESVLPPAARRLPARGRVPLSLRFAALDLLGFEGVGPGAVASYTDGARHFRLALFVKNDTDSAEDVRKTLRKLPGARGLKGAPYDATRVVEVEPRSGAGREWIFGQKGVSVGGASLDAPPRAAPRGAPPERDRAVLEMKRLLDGL